MERSPATDAVTRQGEQLAAVTRQGEQLAAVTNGIVRLFREYYGRGPTKAKSYILDDRIVVCVLEDTMTTVEQTLVKNGYTDMVRQVRLKFQEAMAAPTTEAIERLSGRKVIGYHSQIVFDPEHAFEICVLDGPPQR